MEWRWKGEAPPRKFRVCQSTKKVMPTIFWDSEDILLTDFKERNTTVNATYYVALVRKLRQNIRDSRRGKLTRKMVCCTTMHPCTLLQLRKTQFVIELFNKSITLLIAKIWPPVTITCLKNWKKPSRMPFWRRRRGEGCSFGTFWDQAERIFF